MNLSKTIETKKYDNKKVLVTGGTGFIGNRLAERLVIEERAKVRVLVHTWPKATWVSRLDVELIQGDIANPADVDKAVEDCEIVFHCVGVGGSLDTCTKVNVTGTKYVLEACKKHDVKRIVYLSSSVVHGPNTFEGMDESTPYKYTGDPYADSKIEAEKLFIKFISDNQIEGVIIRPTFVWGPISPYYTIDIINQMQNGSFVLVDGGIGSCNAVYVDNVVDLSLICGYHPKAVGEIFLISDGETHTWREFWKYYATMIGIDIDNFTTIPSVDNFGRKINKKINKSLITLKDGLSNIIDKTDKKFPILTRYSLKAPRKIVKFLVSFVNKCTPDIEYWNLQAYSSIGFISFEKSKTLLNYAPQTTVQQGMADCEMWLRDQNYIKSSDKPDI